MKIASGDGPAEINESHASPLASSRKGGDCFGETESAELQMEKKADLAIYLINLTAAIKFLTCLKHFS